MSKYTKEFLEAEAIKKMNKSGVSEEVQKLFKEKMWDSDFPNMLSQKGLLFLLTFLSDPKEKDNIDFYHTYVNQLTIQIPDLIKKLNEQGFIFYFGKSQSFYTNGSDNLYIIEPHKEFSEKVALFGGIESYLLGL